MANMAFLDIEQHFKKRASIEPVNFDDVMDVIQTREKLMFLDLYNRLEEKNIETKLRMIKKINSTYNSRESLENYYEESREGVVGNLVKIFVETIKFILKIVKIIIKTIIHVFVKIVTFPFKAIHKDMVYKAYLQRKKARSGESYYYSTEKGELEPHRPSTKPTEPTHSADNDKEIANINKFLDYTMEQLIKKMMKSENKDIKNLFYAIFVPNKDTINLKAINTVGINICKSFENLSANINRFITNSRSYMNRSKEDDQRLQNEGGNIQSEIENIKLFEGVDISPKTWSNEVTCARRIVDYIVFPDHIDNLGKLTNETGTMIKDKQGSIEKTQKELEQLEKLAQQQNNVEKSTIDTIKGISKGMSRVNTVFMCYGDLSRTLTTCLSKFQTHKNDYKERTSGGKF